MKSSVEGTTASAAFSTGFFLIILKLFLDFLLINYFKGWTTGYRSHYWYTSGGTYIVIPIYHKAQITSIDFQQLPSSTAYTPFSKFRVSYSDDGFAYAHLPEVLSNLKDANKIINIFINF